MNTSQERQIKAREITVHAMSANSVVRSMLKYWGKQYEQHKSKTKSQYEDDIAKSFDNHCAYCHYDYEVWDHVIPMSKEYCGLHVWANLVPSCRSCNAKKLNKNLESFLNELTINTAEKQKISKKITTHQQKYGGESVACLPIEQRFFVTNSYDQVNQLTSEIINNWRKLTINSIIKSNL
jgi:5-methylcytosine-specific restriction endonuclease McrA